MASDEGSEQMQTTSAAWKALFAAGDYWLETRATIAGTVYTEMSNPVITRALTQNGLTIGNAVSATCQFSVLTENTIPRAAEVVIEQRLTDGATASEWLPAGTFYISRRTRDAVTGLLTLECYDALLKANAIWELASGAWPRTMGSVAAALSALLGVEIDSRTAIRTGAAYVIEQPEPGTTIHDVLALIAAANGGNWIITPAGKLRLVPVVSAAGAASATVNVIDVAGVTGAVTVHTAGAVTGIRYQADDMPVVLGEETGIVIDADVGAAIANDLYDDLIGVTYQAYSLNGAIYDPAAELGDYVRGGANGEVSGVLYAEAATLGLAFRGDISAPEAGELSDEYPYIGASAKALTAAKVYAARQVEAFSDSLDQESVFNRLTGNGAAQGIYMVDGQLYVNMTYARSGTLVLGGLNNQDGALQVLDAGGNTVGTWNSDGIDVKKGDINISWHKYIPYSNHYGYTRINNEGGLICEWHETAYGFQRITNFDSGSITSTYNLNDIQLDKIAMNVSGCLLEFTRDRSSWQPTSAQIGVTINNSYYKSGGVRTATAYYHDRELYINDNGTVIIDVSSSGASIGTNVSISGNQSVSGTKSRRVSTEQYADRLLYCYETPSPMFGDVGEGAIGEDGRCYVPLDAVFAQTVSTEQYQVFLQKYGDGDCWVNERRGGCFIVQGTPGLAFGWEVKAKQRDFDQKRLDRAEDPFEVPEQTYGDDAANHIDEIRKEREAK